MVRRIFFCKFDIFLGFLLQKHPWITNQQLIFREVCFSANDCVHVHVLTLVGKQILYAQLFWKPGEVSFHQNRKISKPLN